MSVALSVKPNPVEDTYLDVEDLIYHVCNIFQTKHGGNFDDYVSLANQVFMDVYASWKSGLAPFTSYLSTCIYRRLLDEKRKDMRWKIVSISPTEQNEDGIILEDKSRTFNFSEFAEELSEDARIVVSLVLDTPDEIARIVAGKGGHAKNFRSTVREHLSRLGWTYNRIVESFEEIRGVLT